MKLTKAQEIWLKKKEEFAKRRELWEKEHPESIRKKNTIEDRRAYSRWWYRKNKKRHAEYSKRYAQQLSTNGGRYTDEEWSALLEYYNNTCLCCGIRGEETKLGKLTPDHIIPVSKGGSSNIANIQPLCLECNRWKKSKVIDYRLSIPEWLNVRLNIPS